MGLKCGDENVCSKIVRGPVRIVVERFQNSTAEGRELSLKGRPSARSTSLVDAGVKTCKSADLKFGRGERVENREPAASGTAGWLRWERAGSTLDLIFHSVAGAFDDDRLCMVQKSIQDGRGNGAVVVEN